MDRAARIDRALGRIGWAHVGFVLTAALVAYCLFRDAKLFALVYAVQPFGLDFMPLWTGARVDPNHLYDFVYVTAQQGWPYGHSLRPFVYPPSALLFLKPFGLMPFALAYGLFTAASLALFVWSSWRIGTRPLVLLLAAPPLMLIALAGQVTFLIGGLVMTAFLLKGRPWLAGALLAVAGTIKPQMLVLLPLALAFARDWKTFRATGVVAAAIVLVSLAFGASWTGWLEALPRFNELVRQNPGLLARTITPYAHWGPASLLVAVPAALAAIGLGFRTDNAAERTLALFGGALLIAPYAMNYEVALVMAPLLALRLRPLATAPFWYLLMFQPAGPLPLCAAMVFLFVVCAGALPKLALGARAEPQEA
jgi:hypothetical protein